MAKVNVLDFEFEVPSGSMKKKLIVEEDGVVTSSTDFTGGKGKITVRENAVVALKDEGGRIRNFVARNNTSLDAGGDFGEIKFVKAREVDKHPEKPVPPVTPSP